MCLLAEAPLVGALLIGVLPFVVFLAIEGEMVLAESVFLGKKERIPPELEMPEEEGELPLSGALFVLWYSWHLFSSVGWNGGASAPLLLVLADAPVCCIRNKNS